MECTSRTARKPRANFAQRAKQPNVLHNNCSGKHAGMLALALHLGAPSRPTTSAENPVQIAIGKTMAQFADVAVEDMAVAIDGCGVPVFGITVKAMALAYATTGFAAAEFR